MGRTKSLSTYLFELKKSNSNLEYISGYKNATTKCLHKCLLCGKEVLIDPSHVLAGNGCRECGIKRVSDACRKTHEQFMEEVAKVINPNIQIIGRYQTAKKPIECLCVNCKKIIYKFPDELLKGRGCQKCSAIENGLRRRKTTEQFMSELMEVNPLVEIVSKYQGATQHINCRCKVDSSHEWSAYPSNLLKGAGCPECAKKIGGIKKKQTHMRRYLEFLSTQNLELIGEYTGTFDKTLHKCLSCGTSFVVDPHHVFTKHTGCPVCNSDSSGERIIFQFLNSKHICFEREKIFVNLRGVGGGDLKFDFYLPNYNCLIEFHGLQHEKPIDGYFGGEKEFKKRKIHDKMKEEYAINNGYQFLVIWYYDIDNIGQILTDYLNLNSESVETVMDM